jgi:hypothetical protein
MRPPLRRTHRHTIISALLIALFVRALIPVGFMPATDRPFSFQICPDVFPAQLVQNAHAEHAAHHKHGGGAGSEPEQGSPHEHSFSKSEHCVFAAAAGVGPLAFALTFFAPDSDLDSPEFFYASPVLQQQRHRIQQPRGPPQLS